jgi:hypothetical protein
MNRIIALIFGFCCFTLLHAQKKTTFFVEPRVALLNGDHAVSSQLFLTGGLEKGKWGLGIGTGVDYYKIRTVPLFLRGHFYIDRLKHFSVFANTGVNFVWATEHQKEEELFFWNGNDQQFSTGFYNEAGINYSFPTKKKYAFFIGTGFSTKTVKSSYNEYIFGSPISSFIPFVPRNITYQFNRLNLQVGVRF